MSVTLEITPTAFNIQLIATLSLEIFWSGFRLEHFSPGFCVAFFTFKVATYLNFQVWESFPTFHKFSFTVFITVQMTSILWPNCYLGRVSPLFVPQIGVILLPFFALTMWGLSTSLSIWSSKSDPHHTVDIILTPRAEGQFIPLITFTIFSYVCLSFLRLRWPDETSSHVLLVLTTVATIVFFLLGTYYILLSHWHWPLRCVWQG